MSHQNSGKVPSPFQSLLNSLPKDDCFVVSSEELKASMPRFPCPCEAKETTHCIRFASKTPALKATFAFEVR